MWKTSIFSIAGNIRTYFPLFIPVSLVKNAKIPLKSRSPPLVTLGIPTIALVLIPSSVVSSRKPRCFAPVGIGAAP